MWTSAVFAILSISVLFQGTVHGDTQCSTTHPGTVAPKNNVWRALSPEEVSEVSTVVAQSLHLRPDATAKYVSEKMPMSNYTY
jgi:hypothetical protein